MRSDAQFYNFYRPYLNKICQKILEGKVLILIGINSIGKTLLTYELQSKKFRSEYLKKQRVHLIFLEFKDKIPPKPQQLYKYWLTQTAQTLGYTLPQGEVFNDFSFYFHLQEMAKKLKKGEKIVFVILDAQNILDQGEAFFKALVYLHRFTYRQISYVFLSEPQILSTSNIWAQRFIQDSTNYKFQFLKLFDRKTAITDIKREENLLKTELTEKQRLLILKYSGGLHGVIGALAYFLKNNPQVKDSRVLKKIVSQDKMFQYWIENILQSLPPPSLRILKEVASDKKVFQRYKKDIHGKWLVDLGFLKKNGNFRHPLMLPILTGFNPGQKYINNQLRLVNNQFYFRREVIKFTKNEKMILKELYKAKGKLVTYDAIGEILWKNQPDKFSLWAISQIIRRLRKKLSFYSINPKIISSQRGEGYILN